jgi:transmembrane sensor
MNNAYLIELLDKYLKGRASKEESDLLLCYFDLFHSEFSPLDLMDVVEKDDLENEMELKIWQEIDLQENQQIKNPSRVKWMYQTAAVAILLMIMTTGIFFLNQSPEEKPNIISRSDLTKENRLIRLPDGSTVIVSAGSRINYPSSFDGIATREVYLEGQAYFDVKHNLNKPFIIHTGEISTTVLGTAFNLKAWPTDPNITITVTRGKVKVANEHKTLGFIMPDEQIIYNKDNEAFVQNKVDTHALLDLKDQSLLLDDVTISEAAELLESRFKVRISITEEEVSNKRFTTIVRKGENLEKVLSSICEFAGADYQYDKETSLIIISPKKKRNSN